VKKSSDQEVLGRTIKICTESFFPLSFGKSPSSFWEQNHAIKLHIGNNPIFASISSLFFA
jgi:hypothetical protein